MNISDFEAFLRAELEPFLRRREAAKSGKKAVGAIGGSKRSTGKVGSKVGKNPRKLGEKDLGLV